MVILLFVIAAIIFALCASIAVYIFTTIYTKQSFPLRKIIYTLLIMLPFCVIHLLIVIKFTSFKWLVPFIACLTYIIVTTTLYKPTLLKTTFVILSQAIYTFALDLIGVLIVTLLGKDASFLSSTPTNYLNCVIVTNIFSMLILLSIYLIFSKKSRLLILKDNHKYIAYQAITILLCLIPSMYLMFSNFYKYPLTFVIINALQLIVVYLFSIIYLKNGIVFKDTELELENTKLHNKALATINEGIRGLKHDMGNMLQAINGYISVGNIDGVKDYCKNLLHGFNDVNILSILSPKVINEPAIYGVVVSKILYARDNNLTLSLDVGVDVSKINFPSFELSRIIGILLDNAIEASLESEERKIKLEMYYDENRKSDIIIIGNSVKDPEKVDIIKMFDKDYSTKENPSGFGLYEVLKFLKKHNKGDIVPNIDYEKVFFTQTLTFEK